MKAIKTTVLNPAFCFPLMKQNTRVAAEKVVEWILLRTDSKKWDQTFKSSPGFQIHKKEPDLQSASQPSAFGFGSGRNPNAHALQ